MSNRGFLVRSEDLGRCTFQGVGAIAKSFGGGGHTHAAGFSMDFQKGTQFFQQLLDNRIKS